MAHGLDSVIPVLRRWAAHSDDPLPANWEEWRSNNTSLAMEIQARDPQLVALLSGSASAGLRADALSNAFSPVPPSAKESADIAKSKLVQSLWDKKQSINLTERLQLQAIAPDVYEKFEKQFGSGKAAAPVPDHIAQDNAARERARIAARNRITGKIS